VGASGCRVGGCRLARRRAPTHLTPTNPAQKRTRNRLRRASVFHPAPLPPAARPSLPRSLLQPTTSPAGAPVGLSKSQEAALRYLLQQTGPVPVDHLDGRVPRALVARGLVEESRGWVSPSPTAAPQLLSHTRTGRERSARRAARTPRGARSDAILRAVEALELALPRGAELMIGTLPAYADDVLAGLRRLAREME
jgi:hypothetical protein